MPALRAVAVFLFALVAACAAGTEAPLRVLAQAEPLVADPAAAGRTEQEAVAAEPPPAAPREPVPTGIEAAATEPATAPSEPSAENRSESKAAPPPAKAPAKAKAPAPAIDTPPKAEDPPPAARGAAPPLDVAALKARLRDTKAIGMFTKLALKNQVDDLLEKFRAHYLSGQKTSVAALRQAYDMLVLKVLALIQDGDPSLARTISGSREAIWGILADPEKFRSISG